MSFIPEYLPLSLFRGKKEGEIVQFYYDNLLIELLLTSCKTDLIPLESKKFLFKEDVLEKTHKIGSIPFNEQAECFICKKGKLVPVKQEMFPIHSESTELVLDRSKIIDDKLKVCFVVPECEKGEVWLAIHKTYIWVVMKNKTGIILELDGIKVAGKDLSYRLLPGIVDFFRLYIDLRDIKSL